MPPKKKAPPVGDVPIKPSKALNPKRNDKLTSGGLKLRKGQPRPGDGRTDVNVPTTKEFGNAKIDRDWLEQQVELGLIEAIDPDDMDVPFGAMLRWTGNDEDLGSYWVLPEPHKRCRGKSKVRDKEGRPIVNGDTNEPLLRPCASPTILGGKVCVRHGGGTEAVRNAAKMRLLAASDKLIGALISIGLNAELDPKARVAAINSALDRAGIKGITEITLQTPEWQNMMADMFSEWGTGEKGDDDDE